VSWERLMQTIPEPNAQRAELIRTAVLALGDQLEARPRPTPQRDAMAWQQLAERERLPLLPLLALAEELRPLHACLGGLNRLAPRPLQP
jgi:hypothetical protein